MFLTGRLWLKLSWLCPNDNLDLVPPCHAQTSTPHAQAQVSCFVPSCQACTASYKCGVGKCLFRSRKLSLVSRQLRAHPGVLWRGYCRCKGPVVSAEVPVGMRSPRLPDEKHRFCQADSESVVALFRKLCQLIKL